MTFRTFVTFSAAALFMAWCALALVGGVSVPEERTVGDHGVEVGFLEEPAGLGAAGFAVVRRRS